MLSVADLLAKLDESERRDLINELGAGLHHARMAAQCVTDPSRHAEHVTQLLAYLSGAIVELSAARELVRHRA